MSWRILFIWRSVFDAIVSVLGSFNTLIYWRHTCGWKDYLFLAPHDFCPFFFSSCCVHDFQRQTDSCLIISTFSPHIQNMCQLVLFSRSCDLRNLLSSNQASCLHYICFCKPKRKKGYIIEMEWIDIRYDVIAGLLSGGIGWATQICSSWGESFVPRLWRRAWWCLESKEESVGDIASGLAHKHRFGCLLQGYSINNISRCLHGVNYSRRIN